MKRQTDTCAEELASSERHSLINAELEKLYDPSLGQVTGEDTTVKRMKYESRETGLCRRCDSLDLDQAFAAKDPSRYFRSRCVTKLGKLGAQIQESPCPLCTFFNK